MILCVNGCSHSVGRCVDHLNNWPRLLMNELTTKHEFHTSLMIDTKIDEGNHLFNFARNGAGNDYIFHNSLERITQIIDMGHKPDLVVIQWSGPNRRYLVSPEGKTMFVNLHDNTDYYIKLEPMGTENTIHYMFLMQEFLKSNKIEYYFFNYMSLDESMVESNLFNKIDFEKFVDFNLGKNILNVGLMGLIQQMGYGCDGDNDLHPNLSGNMFIKDEIVKKINKPNNHRTLSLI